MRDPDGLTQLEADRVVRTLRQPAQASDFLRSPLARSWVEAGLLTSFEFETASRLLSPRLPFVSFPSEWCAAQLHAAGELTLRLEAEAEAAGFELKDASAWNVLFEGAAPRFCDLLSPRPLRQRRWWAGGQFSRHFLLPLVMARQGGLLAHECFQVWRDGVPPAAVRRALGARRWLGRYWPLMTEPRVAASSAAMKPEADVELPVAQAYRRNLHQGMSWMLAGLKPAAKPQAGRATVWGDYIHQRSHYGSDTIEAKRQCVGRWLDTIRPGWVVDLGCNSGEFSNLAAAAGATVIAMDQDHDAIQRLFLQRRGDTRVYPVLAQLDDLPSGRGWGGDEFPPMLARLHQRGDLLMMLALIHHLAVAAAVPLEWIARFAASVSRRWLVIEWIASEDSQMRLLCAQRQRDPQQFSIEHQRNAFLAAGWKVAAEQPLPSSMRVLALLERA